MIKMTMLFQVTTEPVNPFWARAHTGGWSESLWTAGFSYIPVAAQNALLNLRSPLLPKQASIVGVRQGIYTISGNKLLPGGTSARKVQYPGSSSFNVNLPQDSLELSGTSLTTINTNRFRLGCLPDEMTTNGEYSPTSAYSSLVSAYRAALTAPGNAWSFIGRQLSLPSARVMSLTPGANLTAVLVLSAPINPVVGTDYIRLNRVYNSFGVNVGGSYLVTDFTAPATYALAGIDLSVVSTPSGMARVDRVADFLYGTVDVGRAVVKKIGRPLEQYRGRASRRPVA
jgi:hypothetical protein